MDERAKIREFLGREIAVAGGVPPRIEDSTSLLRSGLVSSLTVVDMITFLETEFGINIADEEIEIDDFETIDTMCRLLSRKMSCAPT